MSEKDHPKSYWPFHNAIEGPPPEGGPCCQCGATSNPNNTYVTWKCVHCGGFVCVGCVQTTRRNPMEIMEETFCSPECFHAERMKRRMLGQPEPED